MINQKILKICDNYLEKENQTHKDKYPPIKRDIYWTNYNNCNFYDKENHKCIVYDYNECNNTRAHNCKYAKMQSMEKHKGVFNEIQFRYNKKRQKGTIYFEEGYTVYGRAELNTDETHFRFIYEIFKKHCKTTDEYGTPLKNSTITYYND